MRAARTRIWVIEDDAALRRAYERWLGVAVGDADVTAFGSTALADAALYAEGCPDGLAVDHHLPGELGLDWLLHRRERLARARKILITADADLAPCARACIAGIHTVVKPQMPPWLAAFLAGRPMELAEPAPRESREMLLRVPAAAARAARRTG